MVSINKAFPIIITVCFLLLGGAQTVRAEKTDLGPAQAALTDGRYQEVIDLLTAAKESDRRNHKLLRVLGDAYSGLGDYENAAAVYAGAIKIKSSNVAARLGWGDALAALGKFAEADKALKKGLEKAKKDPERAIFNNAIGRAKLAAGNCTEAQEFLLKAQIQDESKPEYRLHLGDAYFACQVYSLAKIEYQAVLRSDTTNCMARYRIGVAQFRGRNFRDALVSFGKAYLCDTTYVPVYYDLAILYYVSARSQRGEKATEYYQKALFYFEAYRTAWPDSNKVLVAKNISLAYYALRAFEKAAEELSRAIDLGVDDPELLFLLGRSLQLLKRYEDAVERFDQYENRLTDADTISAEFYSRRAICRLELSQQDSTLAANPDYLLTIVADYQKAIALDSSDLRSILRVASLLNGKVLDRVEESIWYYDRMTEVFPEEAARWYNAAVPRLKLKREMEAVELLFKAMEADTSSEGTVKKRARKIISPILLNSGRYAEAREFYKKLIAQSPNNCENLQWYAYTFYVAEEWWQALAPLEKAYNCYKKMGKKPCQMLEITKWLAQAYSQTEKLELAEPLVKQGLKCDPSDPDFLKLQESFDLLKEIEYTPGTKAGQR